MATWFITGAARGLGYEIARHALTAGENVVAAGRSAAQIEAAYSSVPAFGQRGLAVTLDVTDEGQAAAAVEAAIARFGRIDVLVNNAGRGLLGAVEETSAAEAEAVFATNVFGLLAVTRAVLPGMRAARSGHLVNIGSMGGFAQVPGWGVYGATKFAVEGLSEAMRAELAPVGIEVMVVEPGSFRTDFLDASSLHTTARQIPDYAPTVGRVRQAAGANNHGQLNDPVKGAAAIYAAVTAANPPGRFPVGPDAIAMVEGKLAQVRAELDTWRSLGASTRFTDVGPDVGRAG
jgi:short-subunit dehydrogenase